MHIGRDYRFREVLMWTSFELAILFCLGLVPVLLEYIVGENLIVLPTDIIAVLGSVAAFVIAFKNSATYERGCHANAAYASISAVSQSFGYEIKTYIYSSNKTQSNEIKEVQNKLIAQHFAWLTLLRYTLRKEKIWESLHNFGNEHYMNFYVIPEKKTRLEDELKKYLSQEKIQMLLSKKNALNYCLLLQAELLQECLTKGLINDESLSSMLSSIKELNKLQNECIEIKEHPYPRNFASATKYLLYLFVITLPFGLVTLFANYHKSWMTIPVSMLIGWTFLYLYKVGESCSNPFEGGASDIPIYSISRDIEIELRETLGETDLPDKAQAVNNILM